MATATDERQDRPEDHDPLCPRADLEQAWNGAECQCAVIEALRTVEGVDLQTPGDYLLDRITEEVSAGHDSRCPQAGSDPSGDCHCELLARRSRWGVEGISLREAVAAGVILTHDPLCPPGLPATSPDRCTWCITIKQAREEGPIRPEEGIA